jgi:hypothetical protein
LLERYPVEDLDIEEVSAEEVVRNIFSRTKPSSATGKPDGTTPAIPQPVLAA